MKGQHSIGISVAGKFQGKGKGAARCADGHAAVSVFFVIEFYCNVFFHVEMPDARMLFLGGESPFEY